MKICIFEDKKYDQLYPLTYLRGVFELKCGHTLLAEKIKRKLEAEAYCYFIREELAPCLRNKVEGEAVNDMAGLEEDVLFINGRWLASNKDDLSLDGAEEVGLTGTSTAPDGTVKNTAFGCKGDDIVYIRAKKETIAKYLKDDFNALLKSLKENLENKAVTLTLIDFPWDLVNRNPEAIEEDFELLPEKGIFGSMAKEAVVYGDKDKVYVAKGAEVHPFVVLDTQHGPVIIDEGAEIHPFSRIEGPSAIGKDSLVLGAKIREGTAIGPVCRVGGEVEESIMHAYSSKYHDGFLGHAYVCEWVNIGALGTNSDLKNDYSNVQVYNKGELVDTGSPKVGCFIGDHSKTSIGTLLNTGTNVGIMSNVVGAGGVSPKFIPSFIWFLNDRAFKGHGLRLMIETAKTVVSRRGRELTEEDIKLLEHTHAITKEERMKLIKKGRKK